MAEITAQLVRELREKTGAGMMDCKKALTETQGNFEDAVDWLRKKGLAAAAKKAGRVAAEGLVGIHTQGTQGVVVEVNAETDFVARNEQFQNIVKDICATALCHEGDVESLKKASVNGKAIDEALTSLIAVIGENMSLRRFEKLSVSKGAVAGYMHSAVAPGIGKIGVLVALESEGDEAALQEVGKKIAMHIAASSPQALSIEEVDPKSLERERNILTEQARASGKPEEFLQKMVEGRLSKFYKDVVLLEQAYVMDPSKSIREVVEELGKTLGKPVTLKGFVRFTLGEGIEKEETDFAAEVKAQAGV